MPNKETYHGYIKLGICPSCRQNMLFGDERSCPECMTESYARRMGVSKEHKNKIQREWSKKTHAEMIEKGICTRCRKRKADIGFKTCGICRSRTKAYKRMKCSKEDRRLRFEKGLCYFCDNPIEPGCKVCEFHHKKNIEYANTEKAKEVRKDLLKQGILY